MFEKDKRQILITHEQFHVNRGLARALFLACGLAAGAVPAVAADAPLRAIKLVQPIVCTCEAPYYAAQKLGYFKAEGLDVEISTVQGTAGVYAALQNGSAQIGITNGPSLLAAVRRGFRLTAFVGLDQGLSSYSMVVSEAYAKQHAIAPNEGYQSALPKLAGARIGLLAPTAQSALMLRFLLKKLALDQAQYRVIPVNEDVAAAAIASGDIDAYWHAIPPTGGIVAFSSNRIVEFNEVVGVIAVTSNDYLAANPEIVRKVGRAIARGANAILDPKTRASALEATYERLPKVSREAIDREILKPGVPLANGTMTSAGWDLTNQLAARLGIIDDMLSPDQLAAAYTLRFVPRTRVAP